MDAPGYYSREETPEGNLFQFLPPFARWILDHRLEAYVELQIELSRKEKIPLLKHFDHFSPEELVEIGKMSARELLSALADNKVEEFIALSVDKWLNNQLGLVDKHNIVAEDIGLVSMIRRHSFRTLLPGFTDDIKRFRNTMVEVDRFTTLSDIASFNALFKIQQEHREEMDKLLQEQQQDLLEAQDMAQMGSFYWDMEGKGRSHFTINTLRIFELEQTGSMDRFMEDVHPDDRDKLQRAITDSTTNGGIYECEYRYLRAGKLKKIWSKGKVEFDGSTPIAMKGTVMDVTERANLLEKLEHNERLFKNAEALTHIGNWSWDIANNSIEWSDEMYRIYGLEPQSEKISFERFISLIHPDHRETRLKQIQKAMETGDADDYILMIRTDAGEEKTLKGRGHIEKNTAGIPIRFNGTCQDISSEFLLHETIKEKEAYLNLLISNAPDAVIVIDESSEIRLWNPKATQMFGWAAEEVIGKNLADTIIPHRYREAHALGIKRLLSTGTSTIMNRNVELAAVNREQAEIMISLTLSTVVQNGTRSFIGFVRDISKEHEIQLALKQQSELLEQKNRDLERTNQELESFNYAASHDMQEPLRKIQLFANRILEDGSLPPPAIGNYLEKIKSSAYRMQKLIQNLLLFSQTTRTEFMVEMVELDSLIEEAKQVLAHSIEETGTCIIQQKLPAMEIIPFQMQQVFTNLLSNAIKYRSPDTSPHINISWKKVGLEKTVAGSSEFIRLSIADNGIGFDPAYTERIFGLFSRLHSSSTYSGTGVGLPICKKIVESHGGFMKAESDGKNGSVFHVYLPASRLSSNSNEGIPLAADL